MNTTYWNDIEIEKKKPFWITDTSDMKLMNYLIKETNLYRCFVESIELMYSINLIEGNILDVGAGVAWTSALLSKYERVNMIKSLDCSEHRLLEIAPVVFRQFNGDISKFQPVVADFMDTTLDENYNVILFCQSLYMFSSLENVLEKAYSLLVPGGILLVIAESITDKLSPFSLLFYAKQLKHMIRGRADVSNNHFYEDSEYKSAIQNAGFQYISHEMNFPLFQSTSRNCINHIGIKYKRSAEHD